MKKCEQTRLAILETAMDIASVEGLGGLTIGRLAERAGMSKSGLFAHFGSREELQVATVEAARAVAAREVLRPGLAAGPGLARARALVEAWIAYMERRVFRGGCFFAAASAEFDGRPGPVRDRIAAILRDWLGALEGSLTEAVARGELPPETDVKQLAFELNAFVLGANWAAELHHDADAYERARRAVRLRLAPPEVTR